MAKQFKKKSSSRDCERNNFWNRLLLLGLVFFLGYVFYQYFMSSKNNNVQTPQNMISSQLKAIQNQATKAAKQLGLFTNQNNNTGGDSFNGNNSRKNGTNAPLNQSLPSNCSSYRLKRRSTIGNHVSENVRAGKTPFKAMPKRKAKLRLRSLDSNLTGSKDFQDRASRLLPPETSALNKEERKWVKGANLPSLNEIKQAQSINTERYFNQIPDLKYTRETTADTRNKMNAPPPPNQMIFNRPVTCQ